jgi:integrase
MPNIITKHARDGSVSYQAVVRVDKRRPIKKTFPTYEQAEAWRVATDAEARAALETPAYEYTLGEVIDDYTALYPATVTPELKERLAPALSMPLASVGEVYLFALSKEDLDTVEALIEHARRFLGVLVPENIVVAMRAKREGLPYRPVTAFEEERLLACSKDKANGCLQDVLILAFDTALMQQEILDLESNKVDLDAGVIRMSETRIIPLSTRAKTVLSQRLADNHVRIFPELPKNTIQAAFIRLKNSLGLNGPTFPGIQKIAIARFAEKMNIHEIKDVLGYKYYKPLEWLIALQRSK